MLLKQKLKIILYTLCCINCACEPKDEIKTVINYGDACCCTTNYTTGTSVVFAPSCFTPNEDGINDVFNIIPISNVKAIHTVQISVVNTNGQVVENIGSIDTMYSVSGIRKGFNGKLLNGNGTVEGNFRVSLRIVNNNNLTSYLTLNSAAYRCNADNVNALQYKASCKLQDQFNPVTGLVDLPTNDPCFK